MSGATRPLRADEVERLAPALRSQNAITGATELAEYRAAGPWRVRVSDLGDALLLGGWRVGSDTLAIRAIVAPPARVPALVADARAVARSQGFTRVLSPVLAESDARPYLDAGFTSAVRLVVCTASASEVRGHRRAFGFGRDEAPAPTPAFRLRAAGEADVCALAAIDAECFEEFWRYREADFADELPRTRIMIAEDAAGTVLGYAGAARRGSGVTLARLAVSPDARRQGVARVLIAHVGAWAREGGALGISLATQEDNAASRALYRSAGFGELPEAYLMLATDA